jgi:hypothetical protein
MKIPDGFNWCEVDIMDADQAREVGTGTVSPLTGRRPALRVCGGDGSLLSPCSGWQVYELLNKNYVEDDDNMFRFDYSQAFLQVRPLLPRLTRSETAG